MNGKGKKGIILLNVVMILLMIAFIGASLVAFLSLVNFSANMVIDEMKAFYLAESGIAQAVSVLRNQAGVFGEDGNKIGPIFLGDGSYQIEIDVSHSLIISTGRVGSAKKVLQLQYNTF
ncbi:MAG: hypothetical protein ABH844_00020 [Candidatus Omnitrophota bacterium]